MNARGSRRRYRVNIVVNGRRINEVEIDPHYEFRHPDITDDVVLELVSQLDGLNFWPSEQRDDWEFYALDRMELKRKWYRLVWCMRKGESLIGVINCFRRS